MPEQPKIVKLDSDESIARWTKKFACTITQLHAAVEIAGPDEEEVRQQILRAQLKDKDSQHN